MWKERGRGNKGACHATRKEFKMATDPEEESSTKTHHERHLINDSASVSNEIQVKRKKQELVISIPLF